jgi:hypothetical protein
VAQHVYDNYGEAKWHGIYAGQVVDNVDPEKRGRVTVLIPGLCEPATNWALPAGGAGSSGAGGLGGYDVPQKGASVFVMFLCGDVDEPIYLAGWRGLIKGKTDAPAVVQGASASDAANKLKVYETPEYECRIDERSSGKVLIIRSKSTESEVRIDGDSGTILIGNSKTKDTVIISKDKIELNLSGTIFDVVNGMVRIGGEPAHEQLVKGTTFFLQVAVLLSAILGALVTIKEASAGPLAVYKPPIEAIIAALTPFQGMVAAGAFLSLLGYTT